MSPQHWIMLKSSLALSTQPNARLWHLANSTCVEVRVNKCISTFFFFLNDHLVYNIEGDQRLWIFFFYHFRVLSEPLSEGPEFLPPLLITATARPLRKSVNCKIYRVVAGCVHFCTWCTKLIYNKYQQVTVTAVFQSPLLWDFMGLAWKA